MRKPSVQSLSPPSLFRKTGLLFSAISSVYLLLYVCMSIFAEAFPLGFSHEMPLLIIMGTCFALFTISALREPLYWLQPIILLVITPILMTDLTYSMYSLGSFIAAEILLYRLGFFEYKKLAKFFVSIAYFYICEILTGLAAGSSAVDILAPIAYMTAFLVFLIIVYGNQWIVYLNAPKPILSLSAQKVTKKEAEYLKALLDGRSIKEIAIDGGVKESTVRNTLARVYRKFDVQDKSTLMAKCENYSIVD
ncbi:MAG TPA: helix-turn-helix transcriptional regulator [Rectinemataceae bacterium]|nr:helix-turn-helix transcriptional regulator [Rectinemataceae bacterium]